MPIIRGRCRRFRGDRRGDDSASEIGAIPEVVHRRVEADQVESEVERFQKAREETGKTPAEAEGGHLFPCGYHGGPDLRPSDSDAR